jgi:hypothetical protein
MIEDMTIRKFAPKTQHDYVQRVKNFAAFLGRSPDTASFEDVRRYQLHLATSGAGAAKTCERPETDVDFRKPRLVVISSPSTLRDIRILGKARLYQEECTMDRKSLACLADRSDTCQRRQRNEACESGYRPSRARPSIGEFAKNGCRSSRQACGTAMQPAKQAQQRSTFRASLPAGPRSGNG